jgi:prolyl oligopeptidase
MTDPKRLFNYPQSRKDDVVEDYHGTPIADPYRWLEDPHSEETVSWCAAQNKLTFDYLAEVPARETIHTRLTALWNSPKFDAPLKKGDYYFYQKNDGLQNQPVLYKQVGLEGEPEVLLDPNTLSDDGTVALFNMSFSKDGKWMAYSLSSGGSDWQTINIRNVKTGEDSPETLRWLKFTGVAWKSDGAGFFYNRYPAMDDPSLPPFNSQVCWHTVGTSQDDDVIVYERPDNKELGFLPFLSDDGDYLLLRVWHGSINRNRVYYRRVEDENGDFIRLLDKADATYDFVGNDGETFYFHTNLDAPKGRIVAVDIQNPDPENWREIIPEADDVILDMEMVHDQFVILYMHDAYNQIKTYAVDGTFLRDIPLPGIGSVIALTGKRESTEYFINFQSYLYPPTVFRYDFTANELTTWQGPQVDFAFDDYETTQAFYSSKDGTNVPMFLTHKKGLKLDGNNPTLLYGYGGFSINYTPEYSPHILEWVELGGVFAVANLRGGSEYGEDWHQAGMLENKQNVFDDFIAASEWLIANDYTRTEKLAIIGRSNGGLLVSACMVQRPDLFGAIVCVVPVTDMLRFHQFSAGRFWTHEYGNAEENADHFEFMVRYSPLHNVKEGATYPPIIVTSADHDDRVVPMHTKKFVATIQAADTGKNPLLMRLDVRSGHKLGKSVSKWIDEWSDIYAFLVRNLNIGG